jgi:hypothetical protein
MAEWESDANLTFLEKAFRRLKIVAPILAVAIGVCVAFWGGAFKEAIGGSIVAAGVVALVAFLTYGDLSGQRRQALLDEQAAQLNMLEETCERLEDHDEKSQVAKKVGLNNCYERRPDPAIEAAVLHATDRVDILEVSLDTMREVSHEQWRHCRADVRIILLYPDFPKAAPVARLRDSEEKQQDGDILGEIRETLELVPSEWIDGGSEGPELSVSGLKLAKVMPTMSYFRIDSVAYFAPLMHQRVGHRTMHLRLQQGGDFFNMLEDNFERLWNDDKRVKPAISEQIPAQYSSEDPTLDY